MGNTRYPRYGLLPPYPTNGNSVTFEKAFSIVNYQEFTFDLKAHRKIQLLEKAAAETTLGTSIPESLQMVGFQSINRITNTSSQAWEEATGLLSIWVLGMFQPSSETVVVVPLKNGSGSRQGAVNDEYFGKVPSARLVVTDTAAFFLGDGQERGKIGVPYWAATEFMGSYDSQNRVLTIVHFTLPEIKEARYVNSTWQYQENPYGGDVINSYNDGPAVPGGEPFGPFYELESSSPGAALAPGESITHTHSTFHFMGSPEALNALSVEILGVETAAISEVF